MKKKILKGLFFESSGQSVIKVLTIVPAILVPRALGPEKLGEYSLIIAVLGTFTVFIKIGMDKGSKRYFSELEAIGNPGIFKRFILHIAKIRFFLILAVLFLLYFFISPLFDLLNLEFYSFLVYFIPVYLLLHSFINILENCLQVKFKQKYINIVQVSKDLIRLFLISLLFFFGYLTLTTALFAILFIKLVLFLFYFSKVYIIFREVSYNLTQDLKDKYIDFKKRFYNYSFWSFLHRFTGYIMADQSDYYFLSYFKGTGAVGIYKLASKFVKKIKTFSLPQSAIGTMYNSAMTQAYEKHGKEVLNKYFQNKIKLGYILWLPLSIGGFVLAEELIMVLYGESFSEAADLILLLFIFKISVAWIHSTNAILKAMDEARMLTIISLISIVNIILNIALIPILGVYGAAVSTFVTNFLIGFINYILINKKLVKINFPWLEFGKILTASLVMGAIAYSTKLLLISNINLNIYLSIVLTSGMGAAVYFLIVYYFKIVDRQYFNYLFSKVYSKLLK
ncbi:MAG: lipopolysaccharide biosynthesis protein [Candidatus Paceibacteria bacterium]